MSVSARRAATRRIALDGMLAAVYFALKVLTIPVGNDLEITLATLAIVVAALRFRTLDACAVAFVGETMTQIVRSGFSPVSTPIWVLPSVLYALALGLCCALFGKKRPLEEQPPKCYAVCMGCALLLACLNTAALYADSKIMGYYNYHMVFGVAILRGLVALATAAVVASAAIPLVRALRKHG